MKRIFLLLAAAGAIFCFDSRGYGPEAVFAERPAAEISSSQSFFLEALADASADLFLRDEQPQAVEASFFFDN